MSNKVELVVSCPYCKRQYRMKLDREEVAVKKTRATCGRCGNGFELATRIQTEGLDVMGALVPPPPPQPQPQPATRAPEPIAGPPPPPSPPPFPRAADIDVDIDDVLSSTPVPRGESDVVATPVIPALAFQDTTQTRIIPAMTLPAAPTPAPIVQRTWAELADPGLSGLKQEPSPTLLALELLL